MPCGERRFGTLDSAYHVRSWFSLRGTDPHRFRRRGMFSSLGTDEANATSADQLVSVPATRTTGTCTRSRECRTSFTTRHEASAEIPSESFSHFLQGSRSERERPMLRFRNAFSREQCHDKMDCPDSGKGVPELVLGCSGLMPISGRSASYRRPS